VSFDVLSWLAEQGVSSARIDSRGEVVCVASHSGYTANGARSIRSNSKRSTGILEDHQQLEAIKRRATGKERQGEIARSYNVSRWTVSRLAV